MGNEAYDLRIESNNPLSYEKFWFVVETFSTSSSVIFGDNNVYKI